MQSKQSKLTSLLRYRGYDSAGIGIHGVPLKVRKKVGKALD